LLLIEPEVLGRQLLEVLRLLGLLILVEFSDQEFGILYFLWRAPLKLRYFVPLDTPESVWRIYLVQFMSNQEVLHRLPTCLVHVLVLLLGFQVVSISILSCEHLQLAKPC